MNEIDPRDRITDHALREAHSQIRHPDLTPRIVAAWQRGEPGVDLTEWAEAVRRRPIVAQDLQAELDRLPTRRRRLWLAAAAVVVALGGAAVFVLRGGDSAKVPFARASAPLRIFRGPEMHELTSADLAAGDLTLIGAGEVAWVDLASSGRLVLGPCTLLGLSAAGEATERRALRLHRGRFEASGSTQALTVDAGFARIVASPASRFEVEIALETAELACEAVHGPEGLRELLARLPQEPRRLRLAVQSGGLELEHDGQHETLGAGVARELFGPASPTRLVSAQGKKELLVQLDYLERGPRADGPFDSSLAARERGIIDKLLGAVEQSPQYWPFLHAELATRSTRSTLDKGAVQRFVAFALLAPPREGIPLARDLWMARPAAFAEEHIVVLAERGLAEFEREIHALVHEHEPGDKLPVLAAVSRAVERDEKALALLRAFLAQEPARPMRMELHSRLALAAFSLDRAGDADAWARGLAIEWDELDRFLSSGNLGMAGWITLTWRYLREQRGSTEPVTVARFLDEIGPYAEANFDDFADRGDIERAFKALND